jgi:hypothetical protein
MRRFLLLGLPLPASNSFKTALRIIQMDQWNHDAGRVEIFGGEDNGRGPRRSPSIFPAMLGFASSAEAVPFERRPPLHPRAFPLVILVCFAIWMVIGGILARVF